MPPQRKAGRLEVEVAANLETFDKDMKEMARTAAKSATTAEARFGRFDKTLVRVRGGVKGLTRDLGRFALSVTSMAGSLANVALVLSGVILVSVGGFRKLRVEVRKLAGVPTKIIGKLGEAFSALGTRLDTITNGAFRRFVDGFSDLGSRIGTFRKVKLGEGGDLFGKRRAGIADRVSVGAKRAAAAITKAFAPAFAAVAKLAQTSLGQKVVGAFRTIGAGAAKFLGPAALAIGSLVRRFVTFAGPPIANATRKIGTFGRTLGTVARGTLRAFGKIFGGVIEQFVGFAELGVRAVQVGLHRLSLAFVDANGEIRAFGKALGAMSAAAGGVATVLETIGRALFGLRALVAITAGAFVLFAGKIERDFRDSFNRVRTLLSDDMVDALGEVRVEIGLLAGESGVAANDLNNGLYQVLSNLPRLVSQPARAMEVLRAATLATATGFTDMETAVDAITNVMNAWNLEAEDAILISDALFATQNQGKTTFGEIAGSIGRITSSVAALNLDWKDMLTLLAATTPLLGTEAAVTGIGAAIKAVNEAAKRPEIGELSRKFLGTASAFSTASLEAEGLLNFMVKLAELDVGQLTLLFGREEAQRFVTALGTQLDQLPSKFDAVTNSAGQTARAFDITSDSSERAGKKLGEAVDAAIRPFGEVVEDVKIGLKGDFAAIVKAFNVGMASLVGTQDQLTAAWKRLLEDGIAPVRGELSAFNNTLFQTQQLLILGAGGLDEFLARGRPGEAALAFGFTEEQAALFGAAAERAAAIAKVSTQRASQEVGALSRSLSELRSETEAGEEEARRNVAEFRNEIAKIRVGFDLTAVDEFKNRLETLATVDFVKDGNIERFEAAMKDVNRQVNEFAGAKLRKLIADGFDPALLAPLARVIRGVKEENQELERSIEKVNALLEEQARRASRGKGLFEELPGDVQGAFRELKSLETSLKDVRAALAATSDSERQAELRSVASAIEEEEARVKALVDRLLELGPPLSALERQIASFERFKALGEDLFDQALPSSIRSAVTNLGALETKIIALRREMARVSDEELRIRGLETLNAFEAQLDRLAQRLGKLQEVRDLIGGLGREVVNLFGGLTDDTLVLALDVTAGLADEFNKLATARRLADAAFAANDMDTFRRQSAVAESAAKSLKKEIEKTIKRLIQMAIAGGITGEQLEILTGIMNDLEDAAAGGSKEGDTFVERLAKVSGTLEGIARGALRIADSFGVVDRQVRLVLQGIVDIASGVGRIASGDIVGGGIQALGGLISLGKGIFAGGPSQRDIEAKELGLALDRLRRTIEKQIAALESTSGADLTSIQTAIDVFRGTEAEKGNRVKAFTDFIRTLEKLGVTAEDITRLADSMGIELDDIAAALDGAVVPAGELADEIETLEAAIAELAISDLFETVAGSLDRISASAALFNLSAVEVAEEMRAAFVDLADLPKDVEDAISAIDLTTEEGRQELLDFIEAQGRKFLGGDFDVSDLGAFTATEFLDFLQEFKRSVEEAQSEEGDAAAPGSKEAGVFKGVTIVQGNLLVAIGQTTIFFLRDIATVLRSIALDMGVEIGDPLPVGSLPGFNPPSAPTVVQGSPIRGDPASISPPIPPRIPVGNPTIAGGQAALNVTVSGPVVGDVTITGVTDPQSVEDRLVGIGSRRLARRVERAVQEEVTSRGTPRLR